jgi:hypothetical protein
MSNLNSRLLIVDACVVRSAGETQHPVSSACRQCLQEILAICHRVAVTEKILAEWNRHMSRFSRKWRRSMAARKKPLYKIHPKAISLDLNLFSSSAQTLIKKDLHLLEASNAADHIIVSRDDSLKTALNETPQGIGLLKSFQWINPVKEDTSIWKRLQENF